MDSLEALLEHQLKDIYSAERQIVQALPKLIKNASADELKDALQAHLEETQTQVERLEEVAAQLDFALGGKKCKGMEGLIEEGKEALEEDASEPLTDAAIIAAAQKVEHYEISAYGSARAIAEQLGFSDVAELLQQTLDEESAADEKLTQISVKFVLPGAMQGEEEDGAAASAARKSGAKGKGAPAAKKKAVSRAGRSR